LQIKLKLALMYKQGNAIKSLTEKIETCLHHQQLQQSFILEQTKILERNEPEQSAFLKKCETYFDHAEKSIALLAKYAWLNLIYHNNTELFVNEKTANFLAETIREYNNASYLVFPFLYDLRSKLNMLSMNTISFDLEVNEHQKMLQNHLKHINSVSYWKHFSSSAHISYMLIKAGHVVRKYLYRAHRSDYYQTLENKTLKELHAAIDECENMIARVEHNKQLIHDLIRLHMLSGILKITTGNKYKLEEGILELESLLTSYQQVNFALATDSIFMVLMSGYFAKGDYDNCIKTYARFQKNIKGKPIYSGNELIISRYYYFAQWLNSPKKLYLKRIEDLMHKVKLNETFNLRVNPWYDLIDYYKVPVDKKILNA